MPTTAALPDGYTFLNPSSMISKTGKELTIQLFDEADKRDPDLHDMYIYNDFFAYAVLDLIDKRLSTLHTQIGKKDWRVCVSQLEALTVFMLRTNAWGMADDGERVRLTGTVYGACLVTVLRGLKKAGELNTDAYPALEYLLKPAAELGDSLRGIDAGSDFDLVCKGIGQRLFGSQSRTEMRALHLARRTAWMETLDGEEKKLMEEAFADPDAIDSDEEQEEKPWWDGGKEGAEDVDDEDFVLSRVWKEYKGYLADVPTKPLRGPPKWDLTKWSKQEKAAFSFDAMGSDDEDMM
ncbi:hypothetical protein BD626DRAFT_566052 [Schizophyllum amplum]|uniref:Uncharacterized protein n=1 Tax=Schizophyllum amplum TaxID=97359 RepID=A0A550CQD1_9AGAR|nr:hypothetical protein BD626DRAFT_566052 [Auriculariopsis ampla]